MLPVRVAGKCGAEVADIVDGMRWAAGLAVAGAPAKPHPARIVNLSFGGSAVCNPAYQDTAPIVSATVSLTLSVNPLLTPVQIREGLAASARPHGVSARIGACSDLDPGRCACNTTSCGAGMLDAAQALVYAASPPTCQAPRWPLVDLDSAAEVIGATEVGADRPANPHALEGVAAGVADNGGSGGGGSLGASSLLALAVFGLRRAALAEPACAS